MNRIERVFGVRHVLLPVVHPIGWDAALESVRRAADAGVPGVFLIDQGMGQAELLRLVLEVRARHPKLWVGVNLLSRSPGDALRDALDGCGGRIDGIWSDNAGVVDDGANVRAEPFVAARRERDWDGLYFGGVAFKYQREVPFAQLGDTARVAAGYMDVVCTSGPGTGQAADVEKLRAMRAGLGDAAMALASGVTAENIGEYLPFANAFLVGTGLEEKFGVLDPGKLAALQRAVHVAG